MSNDYRCTDFCPKYDGLTRKKQIYTRNFMARHPTAQNHFSIVNDKSSSEYKKIRKLFNCKCIYCGVSDEINQEFEIDHFKCRDNAGPNHIDNLLYSCRKCNRAKSKHSFPNGYEEILNPITNLKNVFVRNNDYSISVNNPYSNDNEIYKFYKKIRFSDEVRRLDYLIMNMIGLKKIVYDENVSLILGDCISILLLSRNQILHN